MKLIMKKKKMIYILSTAKYCSLKDSTLFISIAFISSIMKSINIYNENIAKVLKKRLLP